MKRKLFSILALLFAVSMAWADNVNYYDPTDASNPTKTAVNPEQLSSWPGNGELNEGWYYVSGSVNIPYRFAVIGTVNIILTDGCRFTASNGICVPSGSTLNIWAQSTGDGCGKLIAYQEGKNAAIGGEGGNDASGNGPDIDPNSSVETTPNAANAPDAGTITIYGGDITANGNIGGGDGGDGYDFGNRSGIGGKGGNGTIIIYDGDIVVNGNMGGGKGGYGHGVEQETGVDDEGNPTYNYDGGEGGDGGTGTVTINGGYVNVRGIMGGGDQGAGDNGGFGSFGAGNVSLSWSKVSDMIVAHGYRGTAHLLKPFMDSDENVYEGDYEDGIRGDARIINKWLYPYGTMYNITIDGGSDPACLESSKAHAMEGLEITLTAINGYKVSSLTVKDAENQDVSLTDNQNGTWTFTMPAKAVNVTPVATRYYQVSSSNISYDVANASDKMVQNSKTYYRPGATINFEVTVPDGYIIQSLTIKDEDDQNVSYTDNGNYSYTFSMPAKDVTMEAVTMRDFSGLTLIEGTAAFTVTAGTGNGYSNGPENLLDGKYSSTDASNYSKWVVDDVTTGCYVEFNTPEPVIPKFYTLISSDNKPFKSEGCYPISWTIEASASGNDGWTTIATESSNDTMNDELACHSYIFDFNNPDNNAYQYFRFTVTKVEGWQEPGDEYNMGNIINWLELSEMQMYVRSETLAAVTNGTCGDISINRGNDVTWKYNTSTKVLTISGTGPMMYYGSALGSDSKYHSTAPWSYLDSEIQKVIVGDGVTYIGSYAFAYCTALTSVSLPSTVSALGDYVCYSSNVTRIDIPSTTAATLGTGAFDACPTALKIAVPSTLLGTYQTATNWSAYAAKLVGVLSETTGFGAGFAIGNYEYTRTFKCGLASTVCLPFSLDAAQAASVGKFYSFAGIDKSGEKWEVIMEQANTMTTNLTANIPYLFVPYIFNGKSQGDAVEFTFSGNVSQALQATYVSWTEVAYSYWTFQGVYYNLAWAGDNENIGKVYGFAAQSYSTTVNPGDFVKVAAGASIAPFRAYLQYTPGTNAPRRGAEALPSKMTVRLVDADGTVTAIGTIDTNTGEISLDSDAWYDLNGRRLSAKPSTAGVYINNGKKIVIK